MTTRDRDRYRGNDTLLFGIILGVLAFWLFAQTRPSYRSCSSCLRATPDETHDS